MFCVCFFLFFLWEVLWVPRVCMLARQLRSVRGAITLLFFLFFFNWWYSPFTTLLSHTFIIYQCLNAEMFFPSILLINYWWVCTLYCYPVVHQSLHLSSSSLPWCFGVCYSNRVRKLMDEKAFLNLLVFYNSPFFCFSARNKNLKLFRKSLTISTSRMCVFLTGEKMCFLDWFCPVS